MGKLSRSKPIQIDEYGVIHPIAFKGEENPLRQVLGVFLNERSLFRSETVTTQPHAVQFSGLGQYSARLFDQPERSLRLVALQFAMIDLESDLISKEHNFVTHLNRGKVEAVTYTHLFLQSDYLFYTPLDKRIFSISTHDLQSLARQLSFEGLTTYAYWLSEEIKELIPTFNYSATEEYELEMRLNDYIHEAESQVLLAVKKEIVTTLVSGEGLYKKIGEGELTPKEKETFVSLEKKLIYLRQELKNHLDLILKQLYEVQLSIEKIAITHPELEQLYFSTVLLKTMILLWQEPFQKWAKKVIVNHLLDQQLNVTTVLNSTDADGRSSIAFAARYAMMRLYSTATPSEWVDIALNWYDHARRLHYYHINHGNYSPNERDLKLIYELRQLTVKVFFAIYKKSPKTEKQVVNKEFLTLLPAYFKDDEGQSHPFLQFDEQTHEAVAITKEGKDFLQKL